MASICLTHDHFPVFPARTRPAFKAPLPIMYLVSVYIYTSSLQCVLRHDLHYTSLSFCGISLSPKFTEVRGCPAFHASMCHAQPPSKITLPIILTFPPTRLAVPRRTLVISVQLARDGGPSGHPVYQAKAACMYNKQTPFPTKDPTPSAPPTMLAASWSIKSPPCLLKHPTRHPEQYRREDDEIMAALVEENLSRVGNGHAFARQIDVEADNPTAVGTACTHNMTPPHGCGSA